MSIELGITLAITIAVVLVAAHAWWTMPQTEFVRETAEMGPLEATLPPPVPHDVLDDYEAELDFIALTPEGSAEHRLALLEALLQEADQETVRLEVLVDKLGQQLAPAA